MDNSEDIGSDTFFKVIWYARSKNQCLQAEKWRLIELICMFSRWPPKSYRILHCCFIHCLMYLGIFVGVLCWSLFYYASICVISIFVNTLTRKRMVVALFKLSSWCLVTVSVLLLFLTMPWVDLQ